MSPTPWRAVGLAAIATVTLAGCGESAANDSGDSDTLVFASIPSEESTSLQEAFQPVIDLLEEETGKTIEFQQATDYAAIIEGQRAGKIDIAQYGPFSYVLARNSGVKTTAVAAQVQQKGEEPGYQSYGVTAAGSPVQDLGDFRGKKTCFVDPGSTSGYLYPSAGLIEEGIDPDSDITPVMSGGHDASVLAVASGQCDVGFATDNMVEKQLIQKGQLKQGDVRTVWKSDVIAGSPIALSDDLAPELRERIATALGERANVDYLRANGFCEGDCRLGDSVWGFGAVDDAFYDGVRRVCDVTKDEQCTTS
ncbi:phosphate/phosphite/phosphonate ABC transporter substrate-binding protein [Prauserella cavernicola]|uniref:Phosphate/phosphite/phosphonate ABC transporter substrate-binding protein n=1 Tax=Prauserella cavernicola TaxID=2800127 RepID=A0A934QPA6_9PSEU|nr:phosphate/phosphite/phosphonate ABC transporter substrate-binding protein [Prauserella cavernicola]MBK1783023.1 phosphate/phosphite/phosphonate ABC transporter substrate-binding protein [Prauserella cavernicola]